MNLLERFRRKPSQHDQLAQRLHEQLDQHELALIEIRSAPTPHDRRMTDRPLGEHPMRRASDFW